ncbi:MAG: O-antigen ligase family protein [Nitrospiraceae bacterium]|nr:O-antigen ligase family protein [Nitrospiraceae bacterium]
MEADWTIEPTAAKERLNYPLLLVTLYLWALITTPQNRFEFLGAIQFEKIIMAACWAALALTGRLRPKATVGTFLLILFYGALFMSFLFSPYSGYAAALHWKETYWKLIVLYFLILFSVDSMRDAVQLIAGQVIVLFLYEAQSWLDYIRGGSYVYQQGMRRIIGLWSGGGIGAGNAFGSMALMGIPFGMLWYSKTKSSKIKKLLLFFFIMSAASIVYSGTRGAFLGLLFLVLMVLAYRKKKARLFIGLILLVVSFAAFAPPYLKHRYLDQMTFNYKQFGGDQALDKSAAEDAEGRIQGLEDGWRMFLKRPVFGYGPGASPIARQEVRSDAPSVNGEGQVFMQLHNFYGQILSESGIIGTGLFVLILARYFAQTRKLKVRDSFETGQSTIQFGRFLSLSIMLLLFYGFASHLLYDYNWLILFALCDALSVAAWREKGMERLPA